MTVFGVGAVPSPLGPLLVVSDDEGHVRALDFADHDARLRRLLVRYHGHVSLAPAPAPPGTRQAIAAYFAGALEALDTIAVRTGGTPFQQRVWSALRRIPAGSTTTYGALATALGCAPAPRAVGAANGANPVVLVVPCHRVVGAGGALTGYGGGIARKEWLLHHEARRARRLHEERPA